MCVLYNIYTYICMLYNTYIYIYIYIYVIYREGEMNIYAQIYMYICENFIQVDQYGHPQKCSQKQKVNDIYIYIYMYIYIYLYIYICRRRDEYVCTNIFVYISRLYPVRILFRLTSMGTPKNVPQNKNLMLYIYIYIYIYICIYVLYM